MSNRWAGGYGYHRILKADIEPPSLHYPSIGRPEKRIGNLFDGLCPCASFGVRIHHGQGEEAWAFYTYRMRT